MRENHPSAGDHTDPSRVARHFLSALESMDIDAALSCFADSAVQEMPFAPPGFPTRLEGMDALRRQYGGLPEAYTRMSFPVSATRPLADPQWVLLEYSGSIEQRDGSRYDNEYVGLFHVHDGKIVHFREYFNPLVLQAAFGDRMGETFTVPDP